MKRPPNLALLLAWIAFLGCDSPRDEQAVDIVGEECYEECDKADAEIRLDVRVSRADDSVRVATIPFYLRKVNYGFSDSGSESRYADGVDDGGNSWYTQTHLSLSDITLRDARFELSYRYGEVGKTPTVDLRIDTSLSLTDTTNRALEDGIIIESSVVQLRTGEQQN